MTGDAGSGATDECQLCHWLLLKIRLPTTSGKILWLNMGDGNFAGPEHGGWKFRRPGVGTPKTLRWAPQNLKSAT